MLILNPCLLFTVYCLLFTFCRLLIGNWELVTGNWLLLYTLRMISFKRFSAMLIGSGLAATVTVSAENWPQWRGPGSQGISPEANVPTEWSSTKNVAWKAELPSGHSSPIVWGDRVFVTAAIEGDVVPGAKAVGHTVDGQVWLHPDSVAADRAHTLKVLALDARSGKLLWDRTAYSGTVYDARHKRSSFAGPTAVTDGRLVYAYFGPEGLYAYDGMTLERQ